VSTQAPETQERGRCPKGNHTCMQTWECPHGLTYRRHTPSGRFITANEGPRQGETPCKECTDRHKEMLGSVSDEYLVHRLNQALELTEEWKD
jgi:hypothetical protein